MELRRLLRLVLPNVVLLDGKPRQLLQLTGRLKTPNIANLREDTSYCGKSDTFDFEQFRNLRYLAAQEVCLGHDPFVLPSLSVTILQ